MNLDTGKMMECAEFLEENSNQIKRVCEEIEEYIQIASQCMDQASGRGAAQRMAESVENIKNNVPINDDACKRLVLSLKHVGDAEKVFGGR